MNVILFKGSTQYGVLNLFIDEIKKNLEDKDCSVTIIKLENNYIEQISEICSKNKIDLIISFNGMLSDLNVNNESLYDIINTNYLAIFVDHPSYHLDRLLHNFKNYLCSFIDKSHVDYVQNILPQNHKINFFLPHGGLKAQNNEINSLKDFKNNKTIDVLFCGTYMSAEELIWTDKSIFPKNILEQVLKLLKEDDYITMEKAFAKIFEKEKIVFSTFSKVQLNKIYKKMNYYIRQYKRNLLIENIAKSGLKLTLCGKGWENFVLKYDNIEYKGAVEIDETINLMSKAKVVLNTTPNFTNGSHERVFSAMLNHAVVFSDRSAYYDEYYKDEENILFYSFESLKQDIEKLKNYINDDEKLFELSQKAFKITEKNHTWKNRVEKILEMYKLSKLMDQ